LGPVKIGSRGAASAIEIEERALPESIAILRRSAVDFAVAMGASGESIADLALAVSEAATNAVQHAYAASARGRVQLRAVAADEWLDIEVVDRGDGFIGGASGGLGLGLSTMALMSADFTIVQARSGTEVWMRFPLRNSRLGKTLAHSDKSV
jgi:serine/threonine-protein kinase RsbW